MDSLIRCCESGLRSPAFIVSVQSLTDMPVVFPLGELSAKQTERAIKPSGGADSWEAAPESGSCTFPLREGSK